MSFEYFMYQKIAYNTYGSFSKFIIRICTIAVTLSVAAMIISTCLMDGFQFEIKSKVSNFWAHIHIKPYSLTRSMGENPIGADPVLLHNLKKAKGVRNVQMVAYKGGIINTADAFEGTVLRGISREGMGELAQFIVAGTMIHAYSDSAMDNEILVSKRIADKLQLKLNQKLILSFMGNQIQRRKFVISGFFNTGIESFDNQYAIVNLEAIQRMNRWSADSIHSYEVFLSDDAEQKETKATISKIVENPDLETISIQDIRPDIYDWLTLQRTNEAIILIILFFVAAMNMATALLILILERTNMIGILKALGAGNKSIYKIFMIQSFYILSKGIIWGNLLGIGLCLVQYKWHVVTLPEESYYMSYAPIYFNIFKLALISLATIAFSMLLMILPVRLVGKISPIKVIEYK